MTGDGIAGGLTHAIREEHEAGRVRECALTPP